jgi:hypothetical protein
MRRFITILTVAGLIAPILMGASDRPSDSAAAPAKGAWIEQASSMIQAGKPAAAVALCKTQGVTPTFSDPGARATCALAFMKVADRLHLIGLKSKARAFWRHASKLDLTLLDDPKFLVRLSSEPPPLAAKPRASPAIVRAQPIARRAPAIAVAKPPITPPGPRASSDLYLGLGGGFDGLASLHIGWCHKERVLIETSIGLVFPLIDTRIRVLGSRSDLTTYVGAGMSTPLSRQDTLGLEIPTYESLYALGQTVHVDLGLAWAFQESLEAFAGAVFVTSLDANDPNQIIFFPQLSFQLSYKL